MTRDVKTEHRNTHTHVRAQLPEQRPVPPTHPECHPPSAPVVCKPHGPSAEPAIERKPRNVCRMTLRSVYSVPLVLLMGKLRLKRESGLSDRANSRNQNAVMSFPCQSLACHQDVTGHYSNTLPMTWATSLPNPTRRAAQTKRTVAGEARAGLSCGLATRKAFLSFLNESLKYQRASNK